MGSPPSHQKRAVSSGFQSMALRNQSSAARAIPTMQRKLHCQDEEARISNSEAAFIRASRFELRNAKFRAACAKVAPQSVRERANEPEDVNLTYDLHHHNRVLCCRLDDCRNRALASLAIPNSRKEGGRFTQGIPVTEAPPEHRLHMNRGWRKDAPPRVSQSSHLEFSIYL
jgi:hypothetical protein